MFVCNLMNTPDQNICPQMPTFGNTSSYSVLITH